MKMAQRSPTRQICICVENEITDEEHLIIDELKVLMMRTEKKRVSTFLEYLEYQVEQRKLRDVTEKVNAVIAY